ncbi:MAG: serine/threonine protein kinase [Pseudomonadota bacterium]
MDRPREDDFVVGSSAARRSALDGLRRSLLGNLLVLVVLILIPVLLVMFFATRRTVAEMSRNLVTATTTTAEAELQRFFEPVQSSLLAARDWNLELGELDLDAAAALNARFIPVLTHFDQVSSLLIGNAAGDEYLLLRTGPTWQNRLTRAEAWGSSQRIVAYDAAGELVSDRWVEDDYDTRERVWYTNAMQRSPQLLNWTAPYEFRTTGDAGVTASVRFRPGSDGVEHVLAMDVKLTDISRFTTGFDVSENGLLAVVSADGRTLGLPAIEAFQTEEARKARVLEPAAELGLADLARAMEAWTPVPEQQETPVRFASDSGPVWSGLRPFELGLGQRLWLVVTVPENDFIGETRRQNLLFAGIALGGLALAIGLGLWMERSLRSQVREEISRRRLGPYTLEEKLGEGGMGTVYRARHDLLRRPTAIKLLRPEKEGDEEAILRFEQEVQITSRLTHPNTVAIYDYGRTPEGVFYYAMEFFAGVDIQRLVSTFGPVEPERVVHILVQACGSLAEAHDAGLIHRDIKPANIMLCERGGMFDVVKVLDFGMVKDVSVGREGLGLTQQNEVMGTPLYLAPEAIRKQKDIDGRSDIYALGAVAYLMLTGRSVFSGNNAYDIVRKHLEEDPVPLTRYSPGLPPDLETIVLDCLAKDPDDRPSSARALITRLDRCSVGRRWGQRQAARWWSRQSADVPKSPVGGTPSSPLEITAQFDSE